MRRDVAREAAAHTWPRAPHGARAGTRHGTCALQLSHSLVRSPSADALKSPPRLTSPRAQRARADEKPSRHCASTCACRRPPSAVNSQQQSPPDATPPMNAFVLTPRFGACGGRVALFGAPNRKHSVARRRVVPVAVSSGRAVSTADAAFSQPDVGGVGGVPSKRERAVVDAFRPTADELLPPPRQPSAAAASVVRALPDVPVVPDRTKAQPRENTSAGGGASGGASLNFQAREDVVDVDAAWLTKGKSNAFARTLEIWLFFIRMVLAELKIRKLQNVAEMAAARRVQAAKLKRGLLTLGPTFIKLGQLLSTRVDVVAKEYIDELSELQDRVPGFSGQRAVFDSFEMTPIAAASLGQVHRAVYNGQPVAVKIQRAGLRELFSVDLKNLKLLAVLLDKLDPKTDGTSRNWVQIYDESAKLLYEEIDYINEARNADNFRDNFADVEWVKVPGVYWQLTTEKVLTMEYVPGIKINDYDALERAGLDRRLLAERSAESYLTQLLRHGYFHTDPHCGNLAVDAVAGGRLIYYDFGMMSTFEPDIKRGLVDAVFAIYEGNIRDICNAMQLMGVLKPSADRVTVEKVGRYFLGLFRTNLDNENRKKTKEEKRAEMIKRLDSIGEDLVALGDDGCFNFPPVFTFVFRSFTTLEGIGKGLYAKYDLTMIAGPYLKELIDLKDGSAAITAVNSFRKKLGWRNEDFSALVTQPRKTAYIEETLRRMESGDLKLRVRVLESERATTFSNMAIVLTASAERFAVQARLLWLLAAIFAVKLIIGIVKYRALDARLRNVIADAQRFGAFYISLLFLALLYTDVHFVLAFSRCCRWLRGGLAILEWL
ncbi:Protein kinase-like protein [Gracilaria domingensis]|nr:Protein kinase-like protein [Gracilaria domingensis]